MKRDILQGLAVCIVSISGATFCGTLLYRDIYLNKASVDGHMPAGHLVDKRQTVKRKLGDNLIWDMVGNHETLYWNDSVQTAARSAATITLDGGSQIKLGESSLVVLERDNDQLNLDLKSGQIVLAAKKDSKGMEAIRVNGAEVSGGGGQQVAIQMDEKKHQVTATTTMADGTTKQMTVDQKGHVEEHAVPITLQFPQGLTHIASDKKEATVEFKYQAPANKKKVLQIASDAQFSHIVSTEAASAAGETGVAGASTVETKKASLPSGTYFWRVKLSDGKTETTSETRTFDVVETAAPSKDSMGGPDHVTYRNEVPLMDFKWGANSNVNKYLFEVASDEDFKNVVFKKETSDSVLRTGDLPPGHLYWRVSAVFGDVVKTSPASQFFLEKILSTAPPKDLSPEKDFKVDYDYFDKYKGIPFHWKLPMKDNYRFVFSKSSALKDDLVAFETTQEDTILKDAYPPGTYYWSVESKDEKGNWVYQDVHKIEIGPLTPPLNAPTVEGVAAAADLDLLKDPNVKWTWDEVGGAKEYHFKLIKIDDGKKEETVLEDTLKGLEKDKDDLPDGRYRWQVSAVDGFGRESKPAIHTFNVSHGKPLEAPAFEMSEVQ